MARELIVPGVAFLLCGFLAAPPRFPGTGGAAIARSGGQGVRATSGTSSGARS